MVLTDKNKQHIDSLSYEQLLSQWRFAPGGDPWFRGETGEYWANRMEELRKEPGGNDRHVAASKALGSEYADNVAHSQFTSDRAENQCNQVDREET